MVFEKVEQTTKAIEVGWNRVIQEGGHQAVVQRAGTMITLFFSDRPVMILMMQSPATMSVLDAFIRLCFARVSICLRVDMRPVSCLQCMVKQR